MRKYGIEHFHIEQIEKTENPEEREIYWINFYNSYENGYNATLGGDGKKYIDYDLVCKVYQENQYNQKLTAQLLNISPDSVHNILIIKKVPIIKNLKKSKSVIQYNKNREKIQEFYSCGEAARFLIKQNITTAKVGTVTNKITECANHKRKSAYNFLWEFG